MELKFSKEYIVLPGACDFTEHLGFAETFALFMDIASEHAELMGIGMDEMLRRKLFWVTVKTKIKFRERPRLMEKVAVSTWPLEPERLRLTRNYKIERDGKLIVEGKTDWSVVSSETGRPILCDNIYPAGSSVVSEKVCDTEFARIDENFDDAEILGKHYIYSTDIDVYRHMNNIAYIRGMLSMFSSEKIKKINPSDIEVYFRRSCYEGDTLTYKSRYRHGALEIGAVNENGKTVFLSRILGSFI